MRIATSSITDSMVRQIQNLGTQQARLQNQVSTGQRIFQPEDDPGAIGRALRFDSEQRQLAQYARNTTRALELSQSSFSGLKALKKVSDRATEIGTLGGGSLSADANAAYASEVDQLIEQTLQLGNSKLGNDYLYAGTAVDAPPFVATRDADGQVTTVTYAGNSERAPIALSSATAILPTTSSETNLGLRDLLNHLVSLREALTANDTAAVSTAQIGLLAAEDELVSALAENGGVQSRIEASRAQQEDLATTVEALLSRETDADLPSTIVKLNQTQTAYQAALQSTASIMKVSLLDYIR